MGARPRDYPTIDAFAASTRQARAPARRRVSDRSARPTESGRNAAMAWPQSQALFDRAKIESES